MLVRKKSDLAALPVFEEDAQTRAVLDKIDMRAASSERVEADVREWEREGPRQARRSEESRG